MQHLLDCEQLVPSCHKLDTCRSFHRIEWSHTQSITHLIRTRKAIIDFSIRALQQMSCATASRARYSMLAIFISYCFCLGAREPWELKGQPFQLADGSITCQFSPNATIPPFRRCVTVAAQETLTDATGEFSSHKANAKHRWRSPHIQSLANDIEQLRATPRAKASLAWHLTIMHTAQTVFKEVRGHTLTSRARPSLQPATKQT